MDSDSKCDDLPPPYEEIQGDQSRNILEPAVLVLLGQSVHAEGSPSTPLYSVSGDVTSIPQKSPSMKFERVEQQDITDKGTTKKPQQNQHLFYLVHPVNARYRTDIPSYYVTSMSTEMVGNIQLETSKPWHKKTTGSKFKALLSPTRNARSSPLFEEGENEQRHLFTVRPNWRGGRYKWTDAEGSELAVEQEEDHGKSETQRKLVISASMQRDVRDALVALWVLRLWHDTAESKEAKDNDLESLTPPSVAYSNMKYVKGNVALGALAGIGG